MIAVAAPRLKKAGSMVNPLLMNKVWSAFMALMYLNYDMDQEFLPQFEENASHAMELLDIFEKREMKNG